MKKVVLNEPISAELNGEITEIELCDPSGRTLGYFMPPEMHRMMYAWANSLFDDAEDVPAARDRAGSLTTREAIARLEEVARRHQRKQP